MQPLAIWAVLIEQIPQWRKKLQTVIAAKEAFVLYGGFGRGQGFSFEEAEYENGMQKR